MEATTIQLVADYRDGKPVLESVPVKPLGEDLFEILSSPGFAPGFARGDIVRRSSQAKPGFVVEKRGGFVCVQAFFASLTQDQSREIVRQVQGSGGILEGGLEGEKGNLLIFAFPVSVGFSQIEKVLKIIKERFPLDRWLYGNVYDTKDGKTPLNWWLNP